MRTFSVACVVLMIVLFGATPVFAVGDTTGAPPFYGNAIGAGFGAAITLIGAGWGFGRIGAAALESMARQPETADRVQTAMIIIAALLEGATFFSLIVCIIMALKS